jgi:hypothetical protein
MVKTKTTKKVSKGCPEGQVPDGKGGCMPKPKIVKIVKPTADSTAYYKDEAIFQSNLGVLKSKYGLKKQAEEAMAKLLLVKRFNLLKRKDNGKDSSLDKI